MTNDHRTDQAIIAVGPPPTIALTGHSVAALAEVLGMVEEFLRTAGPTVHAELRGYLRAQYPPADPSWLIDMLGFHGLHLHHQLRHLPSDLPSPRENWQPTDPAIGQEVTW